LNRVVSWTTVESCGRQISVAMTGSWCGLTKMVEDDKTATALFPAW